MRPKPSLPLIGFLLLGALFLAFTARMALRRSRVESAVRADCRRQAEGAAASVQQVLTSLEAPVRALARDLEAGRVHPDHLPARLRLDLANAPASASRMGVLFRPFAVDPGRRLVASYMERGPGGVRPLPYAASGDYTLLDWFRYDLTCDGWNEPHRDPATGDLLVDYSVRARLPGKADPCGVVRIEVTLTEVQAMVGALAPGASGYGFLLSRKGVYLSDPLAANVKEGKTFLDTAQTLGDGGRLALAKAAADQRAAFAEGLSRFTGQKVWMFVHPVPSAGWSLGLAILKDELDLTPPDLNRSLILAVSLGAGTVIAGLVLLLRCVEEGRLKAFAVSLGVAAVLGVGTAFLWYFAYTIRRTDKTQEVAVMSPSSRAAFMHRYATLGVGLKDIAIRFIPTGVFIQQMELSGDGLMKISGQVWQRYPKEVPEEGRSVVFPEAVSCEFGQGFSRTYGDDQLRVVPFKGVFPMEADSNVNYPFDHTSVRLRMWTKLFYSDVLLVPDLEAYTLLAPAALPGIDKYLSVSGWKLEEAHFSYLPLVYNTNFGIPDYIGQQDTPELSYTVSLRRELTNPFVATFLPLLVVAGLLWFILLTTARTRDLVAVTGYSASNVLRAVTSLFFPVVLAQINLRNHILTHGLLYVEYYYFAMYCLILLVAANSIALAYLPFPRLMENENRISKTLYWPLITLAFFVISICYLL
jgi:hypothetical protein